MKKTIAVMFFSILLIGMVSCELFYVPPTVTIVTDSDEYDYGDTITVVVSETHSEWEDLNFSFTINGEAPSFDIEDYTNFSFTLTPDVTTTYTLKITVDDGQEAISQTTEILVNQMPFIGTWKTTSVLSPAYTSAQKDIVIIWKINGFELYYYDEGESIPLTYSGRGTIEFPNAGVWFNIDQQEYYDAATQAWETWTLTDGLMKVQYTFTGDNLHVELLVDSDNNEVENYTWNLIKQSDSTASLH